MTKKKFVFVLTMCLAIFSGSWALAGTHPNVVGDWDFSSKQVTYDPRTNSYWYEDVNGILHITNQNGPLFNGYVEFKGEIDGGSSEESTIGGSGKYTSVYYQITCTNTRDCSCNNDDILITGGVKCALPPSDVIGGSAIWESHIEGYNSWVAQCVLFSTIATNFNCNGVSTTACYVAPESITVTCCRKKGPRPW